MGFLIQGGGVFYESIGDRGRPETGDKRRLPSEICLSDVTLFYKSTGDWGLETGDWRLEALRRHKKPHDARRRNKVSMMCESE